MDYKRSIILGIMTLSLRGLAQPGTVSELGWPTNGGVSAVNCLISSTNTLLVVVTNGTANIQLQGNPTYIVTTAPTNGYLTNLNVTTGVVTYVETNNTATVDNFTYCSSNGVCNVCSTGFINIINPSQVTCGQCFNVPPANGGIVTGTIFFNTGVTNEVICISYTNASCLKTTNCSYTDSSGTASFFVHFCPGSSNFCIVELETCPTVCGFSQVFLDGIPDSGCVRLSGTYLPSQSFAGLLVLTNTSIIGPSPGGCTAAQLWYYPQGNDDLALGFPQYAILWLDVSLDGPAMYTTNPASCSDGTLTNWILTDYGTNFAAVPTTSTITNTILLTNCVTVCP